MSTAENYLLGMDCGTTNMKAVILSEDGTVAAEAQCPSRFLSPGPGMHEQDARDWWENAVRIFRELTEQAGPEAAGRIRGICVSSHTVSMLPVDEKGEPLRNAITYQDVRSSREFSELLEAVGEERFNRIIGGKPSIAFLPNKLLWFKKHESELFSRTAAVLQASSYINYKLTGVLSSDLDQACRTQCMDVATMTWSEEIGAALGVDLDSILPPVYKTDDVIGRVTAEAAAATGLKEGIPVLAGCSDALAAMHATGISRLGEAGESSGTTSLVFLGSEAKGTPDIPVISRPGTIEGISWMFDAPIQSSGAAIKWYIDTFAAEEKEYCRQNERNIYDYLNELALQSEPGAGGLLFFPYLLGERAPLWNDYARGMFIGLTMTTTRSDLIRAVFEGTAFALRHVMETIKISGAEADCIRICGGGARSRTWNRIKAAMLRIPVKVLDETSGNVPVGDALIAGCRTGVFKNMAEATEKAVKIKEVIQPDPEWAAVYDRLYPYYIGMYRHLDEDLKGLKRTLEL